MFSNETKKLWGFHPLQEAYFNEVSFQNKNFIPGRITFTSHDHYRLLPLGSEKEIYAKVRGHYYHEQTEFPIVGDWVVLEALMGDHEFFPIEMTLPRRSCLKRANSNQQTQYFAANVDWVVLVTSFNQDLNERRLERGIAMIEDAGAKPIIVVNKSDLASEIERGEILEKLRKRFYQYLVVDCSAENGENIEGLIKTFQEGESIVFLGMSGVGKSTLVNRIMQGEVLKTGSIRDEDSRGRHTTTHRELFLTQNNFWLIDSPGIREFSLTGDEEQLQKSFEDIAALFGHCRYKDCSHVSEPGCAVLYALSTDELEEDRWNNYQKMQREIEFQANKGNKAYQSQKKKEWAKLTATHKKSKR